MALIDKLQNEGSTLTNLNGATPQISVGATDQSKLHDQYSLTGNPSLSNMFFQSTLPNPANLDLSGQAPFIAGHGNTTPGASTQALPYNQNLPG